MTKDKALKMVIDNLELQEMNNVNAALIAYCKEALEEDKPFMEGMRILVEYKHNEKWYRNQKMFTKYEPLVITDFSTMAGKTCTYMVDEILKAYPHTYDKETEYTNGGDEITVIKNVRGNNEFWYQVKQEIENL